MPALQVGRLWTSLADYFIRQAMFEKARDVYEEGLTTVITVRDFSLIFDALTTFETSLLEARMQARPPPPPSPRTSAPCGPLPVGREVWKRGKGVVHVRSAVGPPNRASGLPLA